MIDFSNIKIDKLALHHVGNKLREENYIASEALLQVDEKLEKMLLEYFLKPFYEPEEAYEFVHNVELNYNTMYGISKKIFAQTTPFKEGSEQILKYLYEQSNHPNIKSGDLFVARFKQIMFDDEPVEALGIFKAENKDAFLKTEYAGSQMQVAPLEGINVKKLDKGCLVFAIDEEYGYYVLTRDTNTQDAEYWKKSFLNIDFIHDDNFDTKSYIDMCKGFAKDVIKQEDGKMDQIEFLNQSIKYFDENDKVNTAAFTDAMFVDDALKENFYAYKERFEKENERELPEEFAISNTVLKAQKRSIKNMIKLDTHIQINLDSKNIELSQEYIERGFDEAKGMHFYKVYYNREVE